MFKPGQSGNPNGRPAGVPNRTSQKVRDAYQMLLENNLDNMSMWLAQVAADSPERALDLMLKLSEYILPKLARTETTLEAGQGFEKIKFVFGTPDPERTVTDDGESI